MVKIFKPNFNDCITDAIIYQNHETYSGIARNETGAMKILIWRVVFAQLTSWRASKRLRKPSLPSITFFTKYCDNTKFYPSTKKRWNDMTNNI
jgi:hypothetical protein